MEEADGRKRYHIWIDPSGEVWIEDPDLGVMPLAQSLQPDFAFQAPAAVLPEPGLARLRRIPAPEPWPDELDDLWALHDRLAVEVPPGDAPIASPSLLDLKRALARCLFSPCVLCEHRCGVNRAEGERGICKVGPTSNFGEAYVHLAEEREIAPSLCITLTGCSWHCVYCHTYDLINKVEQGTPLAAAAYEGLFRQLAAPEVRTLSFVGGNPDHHVPAILDFLAAAPADFAKPIVWNSNMYGSPELYRLLDGVVDVYLGDFRYGNDACAARLSGLPRCWEPVTRNWRLVAEQEALLIVRLLLLPGHHDCCLAPMVRWLDENLGHARVSLLTQYHPAYLVTKKAPDIDRRPTPDEIAAARRAIEAAGLSTVADVELPPG